MHNWNTRKLNHHLAKSNSIMLHQSIMIDVFPPTPTPHPSYPPMAHPDCHGDNKGPFSPEEHDPSYEVMLLSKTWIWVWLSSFFVTNLTFLMPGSRVTYPTGALDRDSVRPGSTVYWLPMENSCRMISFPLSSMAYTSSWMNGEVKMYWKAKQ